MMLRGLWVTLAVGCGSSPLEAAPAPRTLHPVAPESLCVTMGAIAHAVITEPTVRAFALGTSGDAAQLSFQYAGESRVDRALESGQLRRQVGLKLRAANSCNVVYVMWRVAPKPGLTVQVKYNPGKTRHEECGTDGYIKVKPGSPSSIPELAIGTSHTLHADIRGDELQAWIDGKLAWRGRLPDEARELSGPAGLRTDNVQLAAFELAAPPADTPGLQCKQHETDD